MCYLIVYLVFDFPDDSTLKTPANMGRFLTHLTTKTPFRLAQEGIESPSAAWNAAVRVGHRGINLAVYDERGFDVTFSIVTSDWRRLFLATNRGQVSQPENARALAGIGEVLYQTLAPDYGFGLAAMDTQPLPPPGEGDYRVTALHDYNFFSPRLVKKLGQDRLGAIPSWRAVSFDDGGLLVEMSPSPLTEQKSQAAAYQAAAMMLGLAHFQQGC